MWRSLPNYPKRSCIRGDASLSLRKQTQGWSVSEREATLPKASAVGRSRVLRTPLEALQKKRSIDLGEGDLQRAFGVKESKQKKPSNFRSSLHRSRQGTHLLGLHRAQGLDESHELIVGHVVPRKADTSKASQTNICLPPLSLVPCTLSEDISKPGLCWVYTYIFHILRVLRGQTPNSTMANG